MRYGLDFGTSNCAIAVHREGQVELIPVDPQAPNANTVRTVLWIDRLGETAIGEEAVDAFVAGNVGRLIVKSRVSYKETILTEFGEEYIQFDADTEIPGRFFQAIKAVLADPDYAGTDIFGTPYTVEEMVGQVLRLIKARGDEYLGRDVDGVVLGRPVRFSLDNENDALAEARLRRGAELAGFKHITFTYEPLGAAYHYESRLDSEQIALVFDFGGGTLDLSLVHLGPSRRGKADRSEDILAVEGLLLGGNTFNEDIMERRLMRHFGQRATWVSARGDRLPMPAYIFAQLRRWYTISLLHERDVMAFLRVMQRRVEEPRQIEALICLVSKNYGWDLFQMIERAKCDLSTARHTRLGFVQEAIAIMELLTRTAYETIIAPHLPDIDRAIDGVLADAGVRAEDVDVVLRTGGSSLTPCIQALLERRFGAEAIREQDVFTSVVSGLAVAAATA